MTDTEVVDADKRDASNNDDDVTMVRRRRISPYDLSPSDNPDKKREEERVHQFLMGLDEGGYGSIRSQLLSLESLPTVSRVYNILVQEETARVTVHGTKGGTSDAAMFATIKEITCTNCKKPGHTIDTCFKLIGYPEGWFGGRNGGRGGRGSNRGGGRAGRNDGRGIPGQHPGGQVTAHAATADASLTAFPDFDNLTPEQWNTVRHALSLSPTRSTLNESLSSIPLPRWIIDTWASNHMTENINLLSNIQQTDPCTIGLPDGNRVISVKSGTVCLTDNLILINVLFVPVLSCNLISVSQMTKDSKCEARFTDKSCVLQDLKTAIGVGEYREGLYYFNQDGKQKAFNAVKEHSFDLWHKRLGHPSSRVFSFVPLAVSIKNSCLANNCCEICVRAKQLRASFPISIQYSSGIFDTVHCDLWGPYKIPSLNGSTFFFLTIVDDHSRGVWVYLLQSKRDVVPIFQQFCAMVTRQFEKYVKCVRSDNGTEFEGLKEYFRTQGIIYETSCVSTPQQNGRVERKHRHILNVARALRFQASLPIKFWGECVQTAAYLINRTPSSLLGGLLRLIKFMDGLHLYLTFVLLVVDVLCIIRSNMETNLLNGETEEDSESPPPSQDNLIPEEEEECVDSVWPVAGARTPVEPATQTNDLPMGGTTTGRDEVAVSEVGGTAAGRDGMATPEVPVPVLVYPMHRVEDGERFSLTHKCYLASLDTEVEPINFRQAIQCEPWRKAMRAKIDALEKNDTWTLVPAPRHKKPLGSKWVYKIKRKSDGSIERYKARLVIFGNHQVEGLDYNETFAPVVKLTTIRTLFCCGCNTFMGATSNGRT
ncbi:PREDICTED: uncharacterized protein LOC109193375 [Ipomoea nil]|uniref:uncharacterized protein LOC109193375 n=1 Tax=Ipomoea nil TaxID=35883 RepID=UPI000901C090|nr:PREDICTED: uncharacterized protein LOC109193375 [Ipomoea nil]